MLKNYFKIALRNLGKHKAYTFINVSGLAIGMACCLLIFMLVKHEWSFDRFHANADNIYRTTLPYTDPAGEVNYQNMMFPDFTPILAESFSEIKNASRFVSGNRVIDVEGESFRQQVVEVDSAFFDMFSFPFVAGNPSLAVADQSNMVVTTEVANAFFGVNESSYDDAIGNTVSITSNGEQYQFQIVGVFEVPPNTSSLQFDAAISFANYTNIRLGGNNWGGRTSTYVQLVDGVDKASFENEMQPFIDTQFESYQQSLRGAELLADGDESFSVSLQPLTSMHHQPDVWVPYETRPQEPLYSYILGGIGVLILIIACINFMTLSIGRSTSRAREVGMRKVMGANRPQLMKQFWGEALMMTTFGLLIGVMLTTIVLPSFNTITGQELAVASFVNLQTLAVLIGLTLVVGLIAGGYPAALLSKFRPAQVLKGSVSASNRNNFTRALVVLQYTISIGLIVGTIVMSQQLQYMFNKDLGYDDDLVVVVNSGQIDRSEAELVFDRFSNRLLADNSVTHVAKSGNSFTRGSDRNTWEDDDGVTRSAYNFGIDVNYIDLMGMEIVDGRNFSADFPTDSTNSVLVNEALVEEFGIENPVGRRLTGWLSFVYDESPTIIGVVEDYNFRSLREEVQPAVMNMHPDYYNYMGAILVKIEPDNISETVARIEQSWAATVPGKPFAYSFLDDDLATQYVAEQRWSKIVRYSSALAILIACLGLFGLATLSVQKRTKEIGIRKVLGASVPGVVKLVTREFAVLVAISAVFAWPLAYFGMRRWLDTFAYRIDLGVGAFIAAGLLTLVVALATISYHAIRAGLSNPVESLKYE